MVSMTSGKQEAKTGMTWVLGFRNGDLRFTFTTLKKHPQCVTSGYFLFPAKARLDWERLVYIILLDVLGR